MIPDRFQIHRRGGPPISFRDRSESFRRNLSGIYSVCAAGEDPCCPVSRETPVTRSPPPSSSVLRAADRRREFPTKAASITKRDGAYPAEPPRLPHRPRPASLKLRAGFVGQSRHIGIVDIGQD